MICSGLSHKMRAAEFAGGIHKKKKKKKKRKKKKEKRKNVVAN